MILREFLLKFGGVMKRDKDVILLNKRLKYEIYFSVGDISGVIPELGEIYIDEESETITIEVN